MSSGPSTNRGSRSWKIARRVVSIALGATFLTLLFVYWPAQMRHANAAWAWPTWRTPVGRGAGLLLALAGAALVLRCGLLFGRRGRGTPVPTDPPRLLIVDGLYRRTRNPMYLGYFLILLGEALWLGEAALFLYLGYFALGAHLWVVLVEEPGLRRRFGDEFTEYCRRVPRWLGLRRGAHTESPAPSPGR